MCNAYPRFWGRRALPSLLVAALAIGAGEVWTQSLAERSPFLPPDFQQPSSTKDVPAAPPASAQQLRLKGVFSLGGEVKVNLFNTQTNKGTWVPIDGMIEGYRVVAYDAKERSVDLELDGEITRFELIRPTDAPIPVATASATTAAAQVNPRQSIRPGTGGTSTVRRRTIVPPRPVGRTVSPQTSSSSRNNRRTVARPGQPSPPSSGSPNNASGSRNNRSTSPRQTR